MRMLRYIAGPDCQGQDVNYVLRTCMGLSHASVRRAKFVEGALTLDGEPCWTVAKVSPGQEVAIAIDDQDVEGAAPSVAPQEPPCGMLKIAYEDDDLLVVNKPAGLVMYPGPGHSEGTLGNYVSHHLAQRGLTCGLHPVQRLDQGTSGLVVFATSSLAKDMLQRQLHTQRFCRGYVAVCQGVPTPAEGVIDAPWAQLSSHPNTFGVSASGKPAVTHYRVLGSRNGLSAVALRLETGRTHQIRIHMSHIGCPLVGDSTYGTTAGADCPAAMGRSADAGDAASIVWSGDGASFTSADRSVSVIDSLAASIGRPALHSFHISLCHPFSGEEIVVQAPVPPDMCALLPEIFSGDLQGVLP